MTRRRLTAALAALLAACSSPTPQPDSPKPTPVTPADAPIDGASAPADRRLLDRWGPWLVAMRVALDHMAVDGCASVGVRVSTRPPNGFTDPGLADAARRTVDASDAVARACLDGEPGQLDTGEAQLRAALADLAERAAVFAAVEPA